MTEERITELQGEMSAMVNGQLSRQVRAFMLAFEQHLQTTPAMPPEEVLSLRMRLICEEVEELHDAFVNGDLVAVADALADIAYVVEGTAAACGIHMKPIADAVHASNMAKVGGVLDETGKLQKPEGWVPPDVRAILIQQGWVPRWDQP
jgi:predicted HAD superfamily Cof-like phosphohydrolase